LGFLGVAGYAAFAFFWGVPSVESRPLATDAETIAKGKYLAAVGDCTSCHTADDGATFAGGKLLETPFGGGIYSANITPSDTGIKGMTSAQFYQIMSYGADSIWDPVYPAMPYTSYHWVTRDDSDAIFAYLMSLDPVDATVPPNTLPFPFNINQSLFGWNLLFAERGVFQPDPGKDEVWNRGAYLVEGLGHCGACHTPRNFLGGEEAGMALAGAMVGDLMAPDITPEGLISQGWTSDHLVTYFATGTSPEGSAFGEMHLAIKNSLALMTKDDQVAVATYLLDGLAPAAVTTNQTDHAALAATDTSYDFDAAAGRALYLSNCSLCHGANGQGISGTMPPLDGNSTIAQADAVNLVQVIAKGLNQDGATRDSAYGPMPAFADWLSVAQMTDLVNYLRLEFAVNRAELQELSAAEIRSILGQ
jgi:mono/diheme cytochrome c family protein